MVDTNSRSGMTQAFAGSRRAASSTDEGVQSPIAFDVQLQEPEMHDPCWCGPSLRAASSISLNSLQSNTSPATMLALRPVTFLRACRLRAFSTKFSQIDCRKPKGLEFESIMWKAMLRQQLLLRFAVRIIAWRISRLVTVPVFRPRSMNLSHVSVDAVKFQPVEMLRLR